MLRILLCLTLLVSPACLPVLVGGLILKSSKSSAEKRDFMSRLQTLNFERERAGLRPLDICSEKYKFDQGWAAQEPQCLDRIRRYRAGELTALEMGDAT